VNLINDNEEEDIFNDARFSMIKKQGKKKGILREDCK